MLNCCPFCGYSNPRIKRKNRTVIEGKVTRNCYCYCPKCDSRSKRVLYSEYNSNDEAEKSAIRFWNYRA